MTTKILTRAIGMAVALTLCAGLAGAQFDNPEQGPPGPRGWRQGRMGAQQPPRRGFQGEQVVAGPEFPPGSQWGRQPGPMQAPGTGRRFMQGRGEGWGPTMGRGFQGRYAEGRGAGMRRRLQQRFGEGYGPGMSRGPQNRLGEGRDQGARGRFDQEQDQTPGSGMGRRFGQGYGPEQAPGMRRRLQQGREPMTDAPRDLGVAPEAQDAPARPDDGAPDRERRRARQGRSAPQRDRGAAPAPERRRQLRERPVPEPEAEPDEPLMESEGL